MFDRRKQFLASPKWNETICVKDFSRADSKVFIKYFFFAFESLCKSDYKSLRECFLSKKNFFCLNFDERWTFKSILLHLILLVSVLMKLKIKANNPFLYPLKTLEVVPFFRGRRYGTLAWNGLKSLFLFSKPHCKWSENVLKARYVLFKQNRCKLHLLIFIDNWPDIAKHIANIEPLPLHLQ